MFKRSTQTIRIALRRFGDDERAATAIDTRGSPSGVSVAIVSVVFGLGSNVTNMFSSVSTALK